MHKKPWKLPYITANTEKAYLKTIRNGIRIGIWKKAPIKLAFISSRNRKRMINKKTGRMCYHDICDICQEWVANPDGKSKVLNGLGKKVTKNNMEIDHIVPTSGFTELEHASRFIFDLVYNSIEDFQRLCYVCHDIKTVSDSHNLTFEEAKIEKEVILIMKLSAKPLKSWMEKRGLEYKTPKEVNRDTIRKILNV